MEIKSNTVRFSLIAMFSALCAIMTSVLKVPSPTGYTHIGDVAIYVTALLFGSYMGGCVGAIGSTVADLVVGYPKWYVTIFAHGFQGLIAGQGKNKHVLIQIMIAVIGGIVMSVTYWSVNIIIFGRELAFGSLIRDLFGQTAVSVAVSIPVVKAVQRMRKKEV